ncbi:MAG: signal peptidase I, partial [Thermomicrobiales bacterium]
MALAALTLTAFLITLWIPSLVSEWVPVTISKPLIWSIPAIYILAHHGAVERLRSVRIDVVSLGLLVGLLQLAIGLLAGIFFGFGHSPYPHTVSSIVYYFPFVFGILAARELIRWKLATSLSSRFGEPAALLATWGLLVLTTFPLSAYTRLTVGARAFEWLGRFWLPGAAAALFATYLALRAGPLASFAYLGVMSAFEWYFPILPNLPWPVAALIGVAVPVFGVALIEQGDLQGAEEPEGDIAWGSIAGAFAIVALIWFNTGVFGVRPAIVHGHSMEPTMHTGDMMLSEQVPVDELDVGDVIRFKVGTRVVLHRIIEITYDAEGQMIFITQGDNNSA